MTEKKKAVVIGSGFGGLTGAALLVKNGFDVTVLEKNDTFGGRARVWKEKGFTFDMGPSWYLMPEVFERFFSLFGRKREDYFKLLKLDPYYQVFFEGQPAVRISSDPENTRRVFDSFEPGGGKRLDEYLEQARYKYEIAMRDFLYRDYTSVFEFFNRRLLTEGLRLNVLSSLEKFVGKYFRDVRSHQILEYAMVFLGNSPRNAPALYSIMSHVDLNLGVWYPSGGFGEIVNGLVKLGTELGVKFETGREALQVVTGSGGAVRSVQTAQGEIRADVVLVNADYHHAETRLLDGPHRSYPESWWRKKVMAPSMFIAYLGLDKKLKNLVHHNLYFSRDWNAHFDTIFKKPSWPGNPCFYLSCPSVSDPLVAPAGKENLFLLVPTAPGLEDSDAVRGEYFDRTLAHVEKVTGENIRDAIGVKRVFTQRDFARDYNAYRGTALGMSHTLSQTAVFRPAHASRKVKNLYYSGHYTHPGVGIPMTFISSEVAVDRISREVR